MPVLKFAFALIAAVSLSAALYGCNTNGGIPAIAGANPSVHPSPTSTPKSKSSILLIRVRGPQQIH